MCTPPAQVYGLACVGRLLELCADQLAHAPAEHTAALFAAYQADVHAAMACIASSVAESGEKVDYGGGADEGVLEVGCCRFACHCCYLHDATRGCDLVAATQVRALGSGWRLLTPRNVYLCNWVWVSTVYDGKRCCHE